jgi:hypothetical protein
MPAQLKLPIKAPAYVRPLMKITAAQGTLDCSEDEILELLEVQGALIAFDIASPGAKRRDLRILTQSVTEYLQAGKSPCYHTMLPPAEAVDIVLASLKPELNTLSSVASAAKEDQLPGGRPQVRPWLTGNEIQRLLQCGSTHLINLVEARLLKLLPGTDYQRGPGGTPKILRASFVQFLQERLLTC